MILLSLARKLTWCLVMSCSEMAKPTASPSERGRTLVQPPSSKVLVTPALLAEASPSPSHFQDCVTKGKYQGWRPYRHAAHCVELTQANNSINYSTQPLLPTVNLY